MPAKLPKRISFSALLNLRRLDIAASFDERSSSGDGENAAILLLRCALQEPSIVSLEGAVLDDDLSIDVVRCRQNSDDDCHCEGPASDEPVSISQTRRSDAVMRLKLDESQA